MRCWCGERLERVRRLPTPLFVIVVLSRFVFGFGLGAILAAQRRSPWKLVGCIAMALATVMAIPAAEQILKQEE